MSNPISYYSSTRDNNFNLIRFAAATLVLVSHSYALAIGRSEAEPLRDTLGMSWGNIAVDIFFVTSGFLIAGSYYARKDLIAFTWARILRIYPGLFAAVVFCSFIVGIFYTELSLVQFLTHGDTWLFTIKNMTLLAGIEYRLPGVFESNPYQYAVNGSLWTLPYELKMYILLAIFALALGVVAKKAKVDFTKLFFPVSACFALIIFFLLEFGVIGFPGFLYRVMTPKFVQLFAMFFIGSSFYIWRAHIPMSHILAAICAVILAFASVDKSLFLIAYTITVPYLVFYLAYVPKGAIRKFNRFGDYSYGIYIYAFPVQQALASSMEGIHTWTMVALSFLITFFFSFLSWKFVEKPSLALKSKHETIALKLGVSKR